MELCSKRHRAIARTIDDQVHLQSVTTCDPITPTNLITMNPLRFACSEQLTFAWKRYICASRLMIK